MASKPPTSSALTQYTGRYAESGTYSRISNSRYTKSLRDRMYRDLGTSAESIGKLSAGQVQASSARTDQLKEQAVLAKVYAKNAAAQAETLQELEAIRLDMLKDGDKNLRGMDKTLKASVVLSAKHEQHMLSATQSTRHALSEITANGKSQLEQADESFLGRMRTLASTHKAEMGHIKQDEVTSRRASLSSLGQARASRQKSLVASARQRAETQNFMDFINNRSGAKRPTRGLFGGLFN